MAAAPLCRYCGATIAKETKTIYFRTRELNDHERGTNESASAFQGFISVEAFPKTQAEAQRFINAGAIVSLRRGGGGLLDYVAYCSVWDGKSYKDEFFCNGDHARKFGYAAARTGMVMAAWQAAKLHQDRATSDTSQTKKESTRD